MVILAFATPILAGLIIAGARLGTLRSPGRGRLLLLAMAGPVSLLLWTGQHLGQSEGPPDGFRYRPVIAIALAIVVFVGTGVGLYRSRQS